ncbi:reverse transcriptase (RNA-dependent DNA polymerase) domain-containing protein [Phthorimaea operculella]|nr:reverse transcriptase (RNA-dependent DNA polymerase) domain-containing protein [Phthorimaea operculella]
MANRLNSYCEKFEIFDDSQNGFRKQRSTTLATYKYTQNILDTINSKKYAIGLLLDMSKAYDRVNYSILLNKLHSIGIRGITYSWFKSYLQNRSQIVEIQNTNYTTGEIQKIRSDTISVTGSIPQGSVLGCILFLIYINNLPKQIPNQSVIFADDVSVLLPCTNVTEAKNKLNETLDKIECWFHHLFLKVMVGKSSETLGVTRGRYLGSLERDNECSALALLANRSNILTSLVNLESSLQFYLQPSWMLSSGCSL